MSQNKDTSSQKLIILINPDCCLVKNKKWINYYTFLPRLQKWQEDGHIIQINPIIREAALEKLYSSENYDYIKIADVINHLKSKGIAISVAEHVTTFAAFKDKTLAELNVKAVANPASTSFSDLAGAMHSDCPKTRKRASTDYSTRLQKSLTPAMLQLKFSEVYAYYLLYNQALADLDYFGIQHQNNQLANEYEHNFIETKNAPACLNDCAFSLKELYIIARAYEKALSNIQKQEPDTIYKEHLKLKHPNHVLISISSYNIMDSSQFTSVADTIDRTAENLNQRPSLNKTIRQNLKAEKIYGYIGIGTLMLGLCSLAGLGLGIASFITAASIFGISAGATIFGGVSAALFTSAAIVAVAGLATLAMLTLGLYLSIKIYVSMQERIAAAALIHNPALKKASNQSFLEILNPCRFLKFSGVAAASKATTAGKQNEAKLSKPPMQKS